VIESDSISAESLSSPNDHVLSISAKQNDWSLGKNPGKDFCSGDLDVRPSVRPVCVLVANGSLDLAARVTVLQAFLFD